jgi:amino acid transporter/mannitol/fructose-specific phosphotransferase system IIA component (Ntr-type)
MISSGIFVLPGLAHAKAGPAVVFSYFLAGLLATAGLLSIAELTTAMPKAGGDYFYISRGLGPATGTIAGLLSWFSLSLKSAFALIGIAVLVAPFVPLSWHVVAALLCLVFVLVNLRGTREAAGFQVILVLVLLGLMISFIVKGFSDINIQHFEPFVPYGIKSVISTTGFVFVSYGGLIQVASIAGEIKKPGHTIPRGMIIALVVMVVLYTLMIFVTSGVLGTEQLDHSLTPISDAANVFWGKTGYVLVSIAAALAFITTANAGIMTASRYLLAVSRDDLLPPIVARISNKYKTPYTAIIITGFVIIGAVFLNLDVLVEAASTVFVLGYVLASVSVIILRESGVQNYRPVFRAPFYPWLQLATIVGFAFILLEMGEDAFLVTAIIVLVGFSFYWLYGRKRVEKESALLHLIEKITAKELVTGTLETELKEIIRERDEIVKDKIDNLVENAISIDIKESLNLEDFCEFVAKHLSEKLSLEPEKLKTLLLDRETQFSTVLSQTLAVPHIVIEGEGRFLMVIARSRKGVRFSEEAPRITTVFVLAGTQDLRNFYLRVLSAIAQIVQTENFEEEWNSAKNEQALKDLVLLSARKRTE